MGCAVSKFRTRYQVVPATEFVCSSYPQMRSGLQLYCLHEFVLKHSKDVNRTWRLATIIVAHPPNIITIHINDFSDLNDFDVDLENNYEIIAPIGLLNETQINSGTKLTTAQKSIVALFISRKVEEFDVKKYLRRANHTGGQDGEYENGYWTICKGVTSCAYYLGESVLQGQW